MQASVSDVIAAKMDSGELDGKSPLLGLDRVQEFRSPGDIPGSRSVFVQGVLQLVENLLLSS